MAESRVAPGTTAVRKGSHFPAGSWAWQSYTYTATTVPYPVIGFAFDPGSSNSAPTTITIGVVSKSWKASSVGGSVGGVTVTGIESRKERSLAIPLVD